MEKTLSLDSIDKFRESSIARGRSPHTVRGYTADLRGLLEWAGPGTRASNFDDVACQYLTATRLEAAPKTTQRRKSAFKAYAKWAAFPVPGLEDYRAPTPARPVPHPLPEGIDGVKRLMDVCDTDEERCLIGLCGMAGLRISEALAVEWSDLNMETMMLHVRGKGDKGRWVPVHKSLLVAMSAMLAMRPHGPLVDMPDRTARRAITRMGRRARLKRAISSHDLRATFGTAAYDKSKDIRVVQELLGHADSRTTEGYIGVRESAMRDVVDGLFGEDAA